MVLPFLMRGTLGRASRIVPGAQNYTSPGTYSFIVPEHHALTIDIRGGGGGGALGQVEFAVYDGTDGAAGGYSRFLGAGLDIFAYGGGGGGRQYMAPGPVVSGGGAGAAGGAYGGTSNVSGGGGGGGAGGWNYLAAGGIYRYGGAGGAGGRATRVINRGVILPKTVISIVVGGPGSPGANGANGDATSAPGWGGGGGVYLSWS